MQICIVSGRIGKDAETRTTQSGQKVTQFSLASSYKVKGEDRTDWFDCTIWEERGEKLAPYLKKGGAVTVTGSVSARAWIKDNEARAALQLTVRDLDFGGSSGKSESGGGNAPGTLDDEIPFMPVRNLP